ncbi:MAG: hydantoinase B/oxoprolinase family protein [Hyphomicrobiaceae bacterium]|nr:hydantoinase B/oxoprolinase family protein [Hyphomicrobiaceae bacterium]
MADDLGYRLGCDVGGTFTDFVLLDQASGRFDVHKILTTPQDPSLGIDTGIAGLEEVRRGFLAKTENVIHGTTLVINAIIERKGARTAIITTEGFRDSIEMRREIRYDIYDIGAVYPKPLVERPLRREVHERVLADGSVRTPLNQEKARQVFEELAAQEVEAVAICLLHAYANPEHERVLEEIAKSVDPDMAISLSSDVAPEIKEFERCCTTAVNAYVKPLMARYLKRLQERLETRGIEGGLFVMLSGGGIIAPDDARQYPVRMIESGPVGGALAAAHLGAEAGLDNVLMFDMGGTTAKACLIRDGQMPITTVYEVDRVHRFKKGSGTPVGVPTVDIIEIGAGGGSIARIDELGLLQVGPMSAGAAPGPICYRGGGAEPTVTDADLLLGYLDADYFLGGTMALDAGACEAGLMRAIGEPLGLSCLEAAWGIHDVVNENMASAVRTYVAEKGGDIGNTTIVAIGGAGPVHADRLARKLGVGRVIVPRGAGAYSALGFLVAPVSFEVARTQIMPLAACDADALGDLFKELEAVAAPVIEAAAPGSTVTFSYVADICYEGQASAVRVSMPDDLSPTDIAERFYQEYEARYGTSYRDCAVQIITLRLTATAADKHRPTIALPFPEGEGDASVALKGERLAYAPDLQRMVPHKVYAMNRLEAGMRIEGPAIIEEDSSTFVMAEGSRAEVDVRGWIAIEIEGAQNAVRLDEAASTGDFGPIALQVLWSRAINIADEMAAALVKTAFSSVVRDNHDFAVAIYDQEGHLVAQANQSTPGQLYCMQRVMRDLLEFYPPGTLAPGDVIIANDPWLGAGHTPDIFIATPAFRQDTLVGFGVTCAHHTDIGGRLAAPDAREVYEEGMIIPITKIYDAGKPNEFLFRLIERNVRVPAQILGDLRAQVAANNLGCGRLVEFLNDTGLDQISDLTAAVVAQTERNMREAIASLPDGRHESVLELEREDTDGQRLVIKLALEIRGDEISIDYAGTSPQVDLPINSVFNMTCAYTVFSVKCALNPHIPNNQGTSAPIRISAPEGSILNPHFPAACMHRSTLIFNVVQIIFDALGELVPEKIMAPSGTFPLWIERFGGIHDDDRPFVSAFNAQGGQGARFDKDGVATTVFPANVSSTSVELFEVEAPMLCESKSLITDSGGPGRRRGGVAQRVVLRNLARRPVVASLSGGRFHIPAPGFNGGGAGGLGSIRLDNGGPLPHPQQVLMPHESIATLTYPGGGGYDDPYRRDPAEVLEDVRLGFVSVEQAYEAYGVVLSKNGDSVDNAATAQRRAEART